MTIARGAAMRASIQTLRTGPPAAEQPRLLFTVEEAARALGIGRTRMFELIQAGSVETVLIGRLRRIPIDALDAFVTDLRQSSERSAPAPR
jgi:excisionase family DNA binding protein